MSLELIYNLSLKGENLHEKLEFLIPHFLPKKMITTIYADGGNGKSYLSAAICKKLCKSESVRHIVYVDLDNPISMLVDRGYDTLLLNEPKIAYIHRCKLNIKPFELLCALEEQALGNKYEGYVFIFDSLRNFVDIDNDKSAMALFDVAMNLREAGATIIALHHSNKDGKNFKGSSHIRNSTDVMYRLERLEGESQKVCVKLIAQKERAGIRDMSFGIDVRDLSLNEVDSKIANMNEKQKDFVLKAKAVLEHSSPNKTQLLLACGYEKGDKWARETLQHFEGLFWESLPKGKNNALTYHLLTTPTTLTTPREIGACDVKDNRGAEYENN